MWFSPFLDECVKHNLQLNAVRWPAGNEAVPAWRSNRRAPQKF
jgi:hypothetical protein